ncbi:Mus7/MMS22 family-domain-containing protein [Xylaria bambusicola]|uniref:Mus7/MMS22 family-domain-containing protein n=1 Tax=Xylaria bambusicola TaxID=326684 RepID=UPI002007A776|nr:Mus7/MMS22 family-domain-containing protein [Xylaria bambusicola]KAI0518536.1 Mus7/MMS22 family-domain-containing protein [Xylaria bambusicola]
MAKWKELGEVPDSDDESTWDSQESLSGPTDTADDAGPLHIAADVESQAIWDVPFSSQISAEENHSLPTQIQQQEPQPRSLGLSKHDTLPELSPVSSLPEEDRSNGNNAPSTDPAGQHQTRSEGPPSSLPSLERFATEAFELEDVPTVQESEAMSKENSRLGRSLRPRKPIQEHPYLLESVQYSKTWKSHGLRPVRVLAEEQEKRRQEEDSQEQEFEDDSQVTNNETLREESGESQVVGHLDSLPELNDASLSDDGEPSPTPEPPAHRPEQSPLSSQEDDELPDPNDIEKWKISKTTRPVRKRRASPKASSKRKLSRSEHDPGEAVKHTPILPDLDDIFDIPVSPPQTSPAVLTVTPMAVVNRLGGVSMATLTPKPSSNVSSRIHSPAPANQRSELIDLTMLENGDSEGGSDSDSDVAGSPTAPENEPDQVRLGAKRIRGVLPASWLRLDQQASARKVKAIIRHRSPDLSPDPSTRKGVAQRKMTLTQSGRSLALFLSDDSDDSDSTVRPPAANMSFPDINTPTTEDDAASIIEEDQIDHMISRSKTTSAGSSVLQKKRKRDQQSIFNGQPGQRKRQQRITGILNRTKSGSYTQRSREKSTEGSMGPRQMKSRNSGKRKQPISRPAPLGILDVVESDAPSFIRIAARTASKRRDKGRSSPSKKIIMLGTRQDTIDAVEVLNRWKEGQIHPRNSTFSSRPQPRHDTALNMKIQEQLGQNPTPRIKLVKPVKPSTRFSQPRRMVKQTSMDNFVDVGGQDQSKPSLNADNFLIEMSRSRDPFCRPAQLEMPGDSVNSNTFNARKKALDAIYRKSRKTLPTPRNLHLEHSISRQVLEHNEPLDTISPQLPESNSACEPQGNERRTRHRKKNRPQSVDVSAPQYTHANDPLPRELSPPTVVSDSSKNEVTGKLLGLAPYGTHYTQHFEVFPLDRGVFFHESTIIGGGRLKESLDEKLLGNLHHHRGWCTFTIDEQTLRWGPWNAQTASELGIIFDWVIDRLDDNSSNDSELGAATPVQATDFVLLYVQNHLSFTGSDSLDIFASRLVDVLKGFERRFQETLSVSKHATQSCIETLTRVLVIIMHVLRLCQKFEIAAETFQMEELLKRFAATTAGVLCQTQLKEVQDMYSRLQHMSFREKGLRNEEYSVICWVTLIRILEEARLPRAGFWAVISSAILSPNTDSTVEATVLEQAWRSMFTLLPLGEFDNTGVAIPGTRHRTPLEGWTIPQRLLRRIFQLYRNNSRQSPSFNDYLRAIVSRCHYLVEQWGWDKCNVILGTIFDFFAALEFHNLRNEEVYQSPQFLEELSEAPSLATSPEDRCFHIYLKLIAMSIKRLTKSGSVKEIRNLVARLLPNHSRQYDKMMATYEAEIAALRNHHDLLCTLFWAAPSELRPSVQSIEGLVAIRNSHKEACLINLRAWSRLSRFVVSSSEDIAVYKPLADWQRNISLQVLEQFLSVESEVNQQLLGMSAEASGKITEEHRNAVISKNKRVAMDLLHFSMKAFLDTMRHTRTLGAASFVLNHYPLEQILTRLSFSMADSDWGILRVAINIIDYFLTRIDGFKSAEPLHVGQSWHEEDAIMLLERKISSPLISIVRDVVNLKSPDTDVGRVGDRYACVEEAVTLAGRLGACLIQARLARFRQFFQAGKYNLFPDISKAAVSKSRKYIPLFLAAVADRGFTDFKDIGLTPLDLFLVEITKPLNYLAYENRLATSFKQLDETFLKAAIIEVGNTPDYNSNGDLFNYTVVSMRNTLLQADAEQKPRLQSMFSKALRCTMDRMRADLKSMTLNSLEHLNYVKFVRLIISVIRSQDLCPVDSFYYQISPEYSPSREDPRLQTAGILSWGLKLEEGESKAMSGLFYLLFPSFKIALANGELANEIIILKESMKHRRVFDFMLSTMLPAIIRTATQVCEGWILLETYIDAIDARLSIGCIHQVIGGDLMKDILALHKMVLAGAESVQMRASPIFRYGDIISLAAMMRILNILSPSVTAYIINESESSIAKEFPHIISEVTEFTRAAGAYLSELVEKSGGKTVSIPEVSRLFEGLGIVGPETTLRYGEYVDRFSSHMIQDIRNNWISSEASITIKAPSRSQRPSTTQSGQGTPLAKWKQSELLQVLWEQMRTWNHAHDMITNTASHGALIDEILF